MSSSKLEINTLRGMACILLVAYHVIGSNPQVGLMLTDGLLREINDSLIYIRMPLFTFLSGIVYAMRPFSSNAKHFLTKKFRRLIFPMLSVGTLFAGIQYLAPGSNSSVSDWSLIHIIPVAHFWFIESLFLIFLCIVACEKFGLFSTTEKYACVLVFFAVIYLSPLYISYFSISGAIYLMPYFLLGMGLKRYKFDNTLTVSTGYILATILILITSLLYLDIIPTYGKRTLFGLIIGCLSCIALFSIKWRSRLLAWVGVYSYSIYLFHVFFTSGTRMGLLKVDLSNAELLFFFGLTAGLFGPIVTQMVLSMSRFAQIVFLGNSKKTKKANKITPSLDYVHNTK